MADKKYDDRVLASEDETALPKPQIQIIVDGKSVFKPGMKTYFVDDNADSSGSAGTGKIAGTYGSCDTVVSTHLVCTCESVCSCVGYSTCSCVGNKSTGGGRVSCGAPCACVPVH